MHSTWSVTYQNSLNFGYIRQLKKLLPWIFFFVYLSIFPNKFLHLQHCDYFGFKNGRWKKHVFKSRVYLISVVFKTLLPAYWFFHKALKLNCSLVSAYVQHQFVRSKLNRCRSTSWSSSARLHYMTMSGEPYQIS